ncbi:MAG: transcriptional repressor [Oscillospiraceae bacterium]|jgi:Fur family ferric uptake transcriptional regulator|nr:transcriptional repressor [Oscillospiraceae bacterium]
MTRGKYKTKQRELIAAFLKDNSDRHITADAVVEALKGRVGQTTVYRNLGALVKEGEALKYSHAQVNCYRYAKNCCGKDEPFYHFMCDGCGRMFHIECSNLDEAARHVRDGHGIHLDKKRTVLYGSCEKCAVTEESK